MPRLNQIKDHPAKAVTVAEGNPSANEGIDCTEYDIAILYTSDLTAVVDYDVQVWGKIGANWFPLNGVTTTGIGNNIFGDRVPCEGLDRVELVVPVFNGTSLNVKIRLVRNVDKG